MFSTLPIVAGSRPPHPPSTAPEPVPDRLSFPLPTELLVSIARHLPMSSIRALSATCKRLNSVLDPLCDSTRSFTRVELPRYCDCCNPHRRLLFTLKRHRDGAGDTPIRKLLVVIRARVGYGPYRAGQAKNAHLSYYLRDDACPVDVGCECAGPESSKPKEDLPASQSLDQTRDIMKAITELRLLVLVRGKPNNPGKAVLGPNLQRVIDAMLYPLVEVSNIDVQASNTPIKIQVVARLPNGEIRIVALNPIPCSYISVTSTKLSHLISQRHGEPELIDLPSSSLPNGTDTCNLCPHYQELAALQDVTLIYRPGKDEISTKKPLDYLKGIFKTRTVAIDIGDKSDKYPTISFSAYYSLLSITSPARLRKIHLEGVCIDWSNPGLLARICPHEGEIVLRNCHLNPRGSSTTWQVEFSTAAYVGESRVNSCELYGLLDATAPGGHDYASLRTWESWLLVGKTEALPSLVSTINLVW